jgi:hypothetical protein
MKKYLLLCIVAVLCVGETAFSQLQVRSRAVRKELPMPFPDKLVKPASNLIIPAHLPDIKKPFVASLPNTQDFVDRVLAQCPSEKSPGQTIVLDAERANNFTANLQWETKYALKASGFNIERSLADTFHFVTVNFASASTAGGIKKNYRLGDHNDYSSVSYYRIKQLNADAGYAYSNICVVKGYNTMNFKVYPSPASDRIWMELMSKLNGNARIMLYDASGKIVHQQAIVCAKDVSTIESVDVSKLAAAVYQVKILMPDKTLLVEKFIKE